MAIVIGDGFEGYNGTGTLTGLQAKWVCGDTTGAAIVTGRTGSGQALAVTGSTNRTQLWSRFFSPVSALAFGFGFRYTSAFSGNNNGNVYLYGSGSTQIGLQFNDIGRVVVNRYSAVETPTLLGQSLAGVIIPGTWQYVECEVTIHDTTGTVKVWVDNNLVVDLSGVDTRNAGTTVDQIAFGIRSTNIASVSNYDDIYVVDTNTRIGEDCFFEVLAPVTDDSVAWTRSAGSDNYALVDEAQTDGDTTYIESSTVSQVDRYTFADMSNTPSSIKAVIMTSFAKKSAAGYRSINLQVVSGATTSDGAAYGLPLSYARQERILETDPNTSSAWSAAAVNALKGGVKLAA